MYYNIVHIEEMYKFKNIIIINNQYMPHISIMFKKIFDEIGLESTISNCVKEFDSCDIFLFIAPQFGGILPPNRIVFQLEQYPNEKYFSKDNIKMLENSIKIFDYSNENIYEMKKILKNNITYLPVCPYVFNTHDKISNKKIYDLIFYGRINKKRERILKIIENNFKINILEGVIGNKLNEQLCLSRYCLNLHYYDKSIFESVRYVQCLNFGVPTISEHSYGAKEYINEYKTLNFIDMDNEIQMIENIDSILKSAEEINIDDNNVMLYNNTRRVIKDVFSTVLSC